MEAVAFQCALPMYGSNDAAVLADLKDYCGSNGLQLIVLSSGLQSGRLTINVRDTGDVAAFERLRQFIELRYKDLML